MKFVAQFYSLIFHPLFIPIYSLIVLFNLPIIQIQRFNSIFYLVVIGLIMINNVILPIITFYMLKKQGRINSLLMKTAAERQLPYYILAAFYLITTFMLIRTNYIAPMIVLIPMAAAGSIFAMIPINKHIKISAHMTAIGSAVAYLFVLHFHLHTNLIIPISFTILTAGIIASSRLYLKDHTTLEIYSGFFVGLITTFITASLYLF